MSPKELKKTSEILKNRVKFCKPKLPNNWRQQIITIAPEYDSLKGVRLMDNVFKLRSSDLKLTEIIESIVAEIESNTEEIISENE
jgi:hypothetical protein